jgi:hypothetical protein
MSSLGERGCTLARAPHSVLSANSHSFPRRHRALAAVDPAVADSLVPQVALSQELYGKVGQQYTNVMACYDQAPLKPAPRAPRQRRANEAAPAASNPEPLVPAPVAAPVQLA